MQNIECLGTICGHENVSVFTWPAAQAGYVAEPLSGVVRQLLRGPIGYVSKELHSFLNQNPHDPTPDNTLDPIVLMDTTLVATPTPAPNLKVVIMLFCHSGHSAEIIRIFRKSNLKIEAVKGYCAEKCGGIPHSTHLNVEQGRAAVTRILGCKTSLLPHQREALDFILKLESPESVILSDLWNSLTCEWLRRLFNDIVHIGKTRPANHSTQGSILADDMGLGKTLTALALIRTSQDAAEAFANPNEKLAKATLVIFPLSTLGNWESVIKKHLDLNLVTYVVYHGEAQKKLTGPMLWAHDIVLATYDTVSSQYESESDALFEGMWFRIILDEAHLIRDTSTRRSQAILAVKSRRKLCLTGTPLQNQLSDLYPLLHFLCVDPWSREDIWKTFIKPNIRQKLPQAIELVRRLVATVLLRRLKSDILQLPPKVDERIRLQLEQPWRDEYQKRYNVFAEEFGVDRAGGTWDLAEFFQHLTMLQLYCNHPRLIDASLFDIPQKETTWRDSSKIIHLITNLKLHLASNQSGKVAKAVVFSQWTSFLN
ncbi:hypothetical protein PTTG_27191, partial [Puccinia triticina 1-1 BBBD Race 1]